MSLPIAVKWVPFMVVYNISHLNNTFEKMYIMIFLVYPAENFSIPKTGVVHSKVDKNGMAQNYIS